MSHHPSVLELAGILETSLAISRGPKFVLGTVLKDPVGWHNLESLQPDRSSCCILKMDRGENLMPDDETLAALMSKFDGASAWLIAHFESDPAIAAESLTRCQWVVSPTVFVAPVDGGTLVAVRLKVGDSAVDCSSSLNVIVCSGLEEMDAGFLARDRDSRACAFIVSSERGAMIPIGPVLETVLKIRSDMGGGGVLLAEMGSLAKLDVMPLGSASCEGSADSCYYIPSLRKVLKNLNFAGSRQDETVVRIEVDPSRLRSDFLSYFLNSQGADLLSCSADDFANLALALPVVLLPLQNQAAFVRFNTASEQCRLLLEKSMDGLGDLDSYGQLAAPAERLFGASVKCVGMAEAGEGDAPGSLPYPLACAYQAYQCAPQAEKIVRVFKMVDAFIEFHSLCALSIAGVTFMRESAGIVANAYNKSGYMDLGSWCHYLQEASKRYSQLRKLSASDDLATLVGNLGVASVYALDQLFSNAVCSLFSRMRDQRNRKMAHGPTWGEGEAAQVCSEVFSSIMEYLNLTSSLWGHVRLGYCSRVEKLPNGSFSSLVERCGQARYGRNGITFHTRDDIATPRTLVLYPSNNDAGFVSLLPFYHVKQIAPSLHIIYHLSRTVDHSFSFNSYAALDAGLKSNEELPVNDDRVAQLTQLLKDNKHIDEHTGRVSVAV